MDKAFDDKTPGLHGRRDGHYLKAKVLNTYGRVKRYWENEAKITVQDAAGPHPDYEAPCDSR
jgi:hypothetical protein